MATGTSGAETSGWTPVATGRQYPARRILIHGSAAGTTLVLAIITLLISVRT